MRLLFFYFSFIFLSGILHGQVVPKGDYKVGYTEVGQASYYNDKLHGNYTASGEFYNKDAMTTAHPYLPFNTVVKVSSMVSNRSVVLKVNDRCAPEKGRILDVSRAAAELLDMVKPGVLEVKLEILNFEGNMPEVANVLTTNNSVSIPAPSNFNVPAQNPKLSADQVGFIQRGQATYYPDNRKSKVTASGEVFDMTKLTAGHAEIPFNSIVNVTNLDNGKQVAVRINDKPTTDGVLLDLSLAAAEELGITGQLRADIRLEVIALPVSPAETISFLPQAGTQPASETVVAEKQKKANPPVEITKTPALEEALLEVGTYTLSGKVDDPKGFAVQVGSHSSPEAAIEMAKTFDEYQFKHLFIQSGWEGGKRSIRVLIGDYATKEAAESALSLLKYKVPAAFMRKHYGQEVPK